MWVHLANYFKIMPRNINSEMWCTKFWRDLAHFEFISRYVYLHRNMVHNIYEFLDEKGAQYLWIKCERRLHNDNEFGSWKSGAIYLFNLMLVNLSIQIYLDVLWMASGDVQICSNLLQTWEPGRSGERERERERKREWVTLRDVTWSDSRLSFIDSFSSSLISLSLILAYLL